MRKNISEEIEKIELEFREKFPFGKIFSEYFVQPDEWIFSVDKATTNECDFIVWTLSVNDILSKKDIYNICFAEMSEDEFNRYNAKEEYEGWFFQGKTITINEQNVIALTKGVFVEIYTNGLVTDNGLLVTKSDGDMAYKNESKADCFIYVDDDIFAQTQNEQEGLAA